MAVEHTSATDGVDPLNSTIRVAATEIQGGDRKKIQSTVLQVRKPNEGFTPQPPSGPSLAAVEQS